MTPRNSTVVWGRVGGIDFLFACGGTGPLLLLLFRVPPPPRRPKTRAARGGGRKSLPLAQQSEETGGEEVKEGEGRKDWEDRSSDTVVQCTHM